MSVPRSERSPLQLGGWLEAASVAAGVLLIGIAARQCEFSQLEIPQRAVVWFILGLLATLWGLRGCAAGAVAWLSRVTRPLGRRRYHIHFRREAYIYMLILVVTGMGAMLGGSNLLLLVFGLMAGPFVFGGQATRVVLQRLRILRTLPDCAVVGQRFVVRVSLTNQKPLLSAWMIVAADTVTNDAEELQPRVLFTRVPPHSCREAMYAICPARRGLHRFGPMRVNCGFPLGLVERSYGLGETQELLVFPRIGRLTAEWQAASRHGIRCRESAQSRMGVTSEEFHRLREYRGGDNPRAIHWRTTARRNELTIREYRHLRDPDLSVVLDLWLPGQPTPADRERVELAVSFAATICADEAQASGEVHLELAICGRELWRTTESGQGQMLRGLLEQLALAEAGAADDLATALAVSNRAVPGQIRRVLVTTRPTREALVAGLRKSDERAGDTLAAFQVIHSDPARLAELFEFDQPASAVTA